MFRLIFLLLIVVPVVELYVLIQVADGLGWPVSLGLLLLISLVGGSLMRWQTSGAWARITSKVQAGQMPSKELVDAALMIFGGALLLTPGFFTDAVGLAMFIPPLRAMVRPLVLKRLDTRVTTFTTGAGTAFGANLGGTRRRTTSFIDVDEVHVDRIPNPELPNDGYQQTHD